MSELSLSDLVANRTMSPAMAALLATAAEERRSLLNVAIPRGSGKSTVLDATLEHRNDTTPVYALGTRHGDSLGLPEAGATVGYLSWSEIAGHPVTDAYLWGDPVRRIFAAAHDGGHALVTSLHADGVDSAFGVIAENEVPGEHASLIDVVSYIRLIGTMDAPERRAIAAMYEVDRVEGGRPAARLIHRWDEAADTFEAVSEPTLVTAEGYSRNLAAFEAAP